MNCFPLNNTWYEADALGAWFGTRTRGVFAAEGCYAVLPNGDMTVTLTPGHGWLKADKLWGTVIYDVEPTIMDIATADGALTRWAAICLQLDKNLNIAQPVVKYGPYGTNPAMNTLPMPVQIGLDYDEIYVSAIRIRAGTTEILASDIVDLRLEEAYCGLMRDGVTGIPTQGLYNEFHSWLETTKDILDEEVAGNLLNLIQEFEGDLDTHVKDTNNPHNSMLPFYTTCATAAATQDKIAEIVAPDNFQMKVGAKVAVYFSAANSHATAQLVIRYKDHKGATVDTTPYPIYWRGAQIGGTTAGRVQIVAGDIHEMIFNGAQWVITGAMAGSMVRQNIPFASGFSSSTSFYWRTPHNLLIIVLNNVAKSSSWVSGETIATMPSGFRPLSAVNTLAISTPAGANFAFNTNGNIIAYIAAGTTGTLYCAPVVFLI